MFKLNVKMSSNSIRNRYRNLSISQEQLKRLCAGRMLIQERCVCEKVYEEMTVKNQAQLPEDHRESSGRGTAKVDTVWDEKDRRQRKL